MIMSTFLFEEAKMEIKKSLERKINMEEVTR